MARRGKKSRWESWEGGYYPPRSKPIAAGGIKLKSQHGKITETWWGGRWIRLLESFGWTERLARGRSYARKGQVLEYSIAAGEVRARVQGSRPSPYRVTIKIGALPPPSWDGVIDAMAARAVFAARLLAGEMPENIEEAFSAAGQGLFPAKAADLKTDCSCPDFANPCKHIAAVYYLLGEEFDRDPFMLFRLRGMEKEALIAALRERRGQADGTERPAPADSEEAGPATEEAGPPLETLVARFWEAGEEIEGVRAAVAAPAVPHALLRRLGPPPLSSASGPASAFFEQAYDAVTSRALKIAYGAGPAPGETGQEA